MLDLLPECGDLWGPVDPSSTQGDGVVPVVGSEDEASGNGPPDRDASYVGGSVSTRSWLFRAAP